MLDMRDTAIPPRQITHRMLVVPPRLIMIAAFGGISVTNYAFSLAAGWLLVPGDFGLLAFAQTLLLFAGLVLDSGISWSLTAAATRSTQTRRAALVRGALVVNVLIAVGLGVAVLAAFALGPLRPGLETATITAIVALCMPLFAVLAVARAAAQGIERFAAVAAIQVVEIVTKAASGIILIRAGFGATGAIAGFLVGGKISAALAVFVIAHVAHVRLRGPVLWPSFHAAWAMSGAVIGMALLLNLGLFTLKLLSGAERALTGYYQVGAILANAPYYLVAAAVAPVLFTQLARMHTIAETRERTSEALRFVALLILPIEVTLIALPEPILTVLFPNAYAPGATILRLLAVGNGALILVVILSVAFQAVHAAWIPARILLIASIGEVVALCVVVPTGQAEGAATVFVVAACFALLALGITYLVMLESAWLGQILGWGVRYGLLIGGSVAVLLLVHTVAHNDVIAAVAAICCYTTVAIASGLVRREHVSALRRRSTVPRSLA